jgi:hypothetical protein
MKNLVVGDLRIEALPLPEEGSAAVQLLWTGRSNHRHPAEALEPYFREALEAASTRQLPIELHFEKLEHFNSSTTSRWAPRSSS